MTEARFTEEDANAAYDAWGANCGPGAIAGILDKTLDDIPVTRLPNVPTFHFADPDKPCAYWSSGDHIVSAGVCRCGKKFLLLEVDL